MDWSNSIPQVTYSVIGGAILIITPKLIFTINKAINESKQRITPIENSINKALSKDLDIKEMYSYMSYLSAHVNLLTYYYNTFIFYSLISMLLCTVGIGVAIAFNEKIYAVIWGAVLVIEAAICLYITVPIGNTISAHHKTIWNKLHDVVHHFACIE